MIRPLEGGQSDSLTEILHLVSIDSSSVVDENMSVVYYKWVGKGPLMIIYRTLRVISHVYLSHFLSIVTIL